MLIGYTLVVLIAVPIVRAATARSVAATIDKRCPARNVLPRMSRAAHDRIVCLAALAAEAVHPIAGVRAPAAVHLAAIGVSVALALIARRSGAAARSLTALLACLAPAVWLGMHIGTPFSWQITMTIALLGFGIAGRVDATLRPSPSWRARGRVPLGWTALVAGVTPFALAAWTLLLRPDLPAPDLPLPLLLAMGGVFVPVNAALEELIWRGIIQDRLDPLFGARAAIALQAASFGAQHLWGVPGGVVGALLAGIWALMLGALRRHAGGLLAPFLAHVVADATIVVLILAHAR
ncbi:MAG: CPBP family intramembrane metalloprotease [Minicystis sp.]